MKVKSRSWGRWFGIAGLLLGIAVIVFSLIDARTVWGWVVEHYLMLLGALLLLAPGLYKLLERRKPTRIALQEASKEQGLEPSTPTDDIAQAQVKRVQRGVERAQALRFHLQQMRWFRWAYDRPWLFVTGDAASVQRLLPELATQYWQITDHAVLLWGDVSSDGLDQGWLEQIRKLRRGRPIDAIVLALDGAAELPSTSRGGGGWGTTLVRLAQTLHWSAPIYLLDLDGSDTTKAITPVMGSEFVDSGNQAAIESALLTLRDRLADSGTMRLGRNRSDRFSSELSQC